MATEETRNGGFAVLITRVAGCWVLLGAFMKLFLGTPQDLPEIVRSLPPDIGLTFKVAISAELAIGFLALLKPRWSWLLVMTLLIVFDLALVTQMRAGEPSCGCFGSEVTVPPVVVLAIDSLLILLILVSRPWSALGRDGIHALAMTMLLIVALPLPWLLDREQENPPIGLERFVPIEAEKWVGRRFADLKFSKELDLSGLRTTDGVWVVWTETCLNCAKLLEWMKMTEGGNRHVMLLELPRDPDEEGVEASVHELPEGSHVHRIVLVNREQWIVTPPALWVVRDGCVVSGDNDPSDQTHAKSLDPETPPGCVPDEGASK